MSLGNTELENRLQVLKLELLCGTHLIISLVPLSLSDSCDDLHELAIAITLHLDALKRVLLYFGLIVYLLSARTGENRNLLRASVHCWTIIPGEAGTFLDVIVGIHALLNLGLVVGKQVVPHIALTARLNHVRIICKRIGPPIVSLLLLTIAKVEEIIFSTPTKTKVNSIKPYFYLLVHS